MRSKSKMKTKFMNKIIIFVINTEFSFLFFSIHFIKYLILTNKTKTNAYNHITKCLIEFYQSQSVGIFIFIAIFTNMKFLLGKQNNQ